MAVARMLRFALVGPHEIRERYRQIASRLRTVRVTAVVDSDAGVSGRPVPAPGGEVLAASLDELLTAHAESFDAVLFLSSEGVSEGDCVRAARAGKHLFCEGPLRCSRAAVRQLVAACRKADVRLMAGPRRRYMPALRVIRDSLDAGRLGVPGLLRIHRWEPRTATPGLSAASAGGTSVDTLPEHLIDEIDLACWIFNGPPSVVYATSSLSASGPPESTSRPIDYLQVHLGFENGGMALLDLAGTLPQGDAYYSVSLIGSTGAAYADDHHNRQLHFGGGAPAALVAGTEEGEAVARLRDFVSAIEERREPSLSGGDILRAMAVAESAWGALSTGCAAPVAEDA